MPSLADKYRPRTWTEVIGQPKAVKQLLSLKARSGFGGHAFWISGKSGQGKTTLAKLIAAECADELHTCEYCGRELNAAALDSIAEMSRFACGGAFIINEAHTISKHALERLLDMIDSGSIPPRVVWVFTTTKDGEGRLFEDYDDAGPLLSRCTLVALASQGWNQAAAAYAQKIALAENLDGQPLAAYVRAINDRKGNLRALLQSIESGDMLQ